MFTMEFKLDDQSLADATFFSTFYIENNLQLGMMLVRTFTVLLEVKAKNYLQVNPKLKKTYSNILNRNRSGRDVFLVETHDKVLRCLFIENSQRVFFLNFLRYGFGFVGWSQLHKSQGAQGKEKKKFHFCVLESLEKNLKLKKIIFYKGFPGVFIRSWSDGFDIQIKIFANVIKIIANNI